MGKGRMVASALVVVAALAAIYELAWVPFRCDLEQRRLEDATLRAMERPLSSATLARETLTSAESAARRCPEDIDLYAIRAANLRLLGRSGEAAEVLRDALRLDQRPELYLQLGLALVESGQEEAALDAFALAVRFQPVIGEQVPPHLRQRLTERMGRPQG